MKLALIYNKFSESTTGVYIEKVIRGAGIDYQQFWTKNARNIPKEFDLYFRIDHGDYEYDISNELHPAVFYVIDAHLKKPYKKIKHQINHYDIVFCAQKEGAEKLGKYKKMMFIGYLWVVIHKFIKKLILQKNMILVLWGITPKNLIEKGI